jgi:hypothetical protein
MQGTPEPVTQLGVRMETLDAREEGGVVMNDVLLTESGWMGCAHIVGDAVLPV